MKVGILGSGEVGQTLAKAFTAEGHSTILGTHHPHKNEVKDFISNNPRIKVDTFEVAAAYGELLALCVSGDAAEAVIDLAGAKNFSGKTVIDTTNPIAKQPPANGVLKYFTTMDQSLSEIIQKKIPDAFVVKAFNSVGNSLMYKPSFDTKPSMFICGNDDGAKKTVTDILTAFGWETEDMGKIEAARAIEPLCMLWCIPGFLKNSWTHAFKLLKA
ncbi:NAD(P)-binding domain-containing protein [Chitinophagaceae bacterium 26-R-25]|nr:NAD(P)-binding domain-containing protein [Chitinophagaceae bacterium 26-R-25]